MLKELTINNIAIISHLKVEFSKGLNIFSGETGAGKSIVIDSINFVLGKRADKTLIRHGENSSSVIATFDISDSPRTQKVLENFDIDNDDDELVIKRSMTLEGKNTCSINGMKVTLSILKEITATMVDIYGQHEGASMLDNSRHLEILDNYGKNDLESVKIKQQELYRKYTDIVDKLKKYGSLSQLSKNIDLVKYQLDEIEDASLEECEEEELVSKRNIMNNSERLVTALATCHELISGEDGSVLERLAISINELNRVNDNMSELEEFIERIDSCQTELKDLNYSIEEFAESCEFDQAEYDRIEQRISKIRSLKRKYGSDIKEIFAYRDKLKEEYEFYLGGEEQVELLEEEKVKVGSSLVKNSKLISQIRRKIAQNLGKIIIDELTHLGMKNCKFDTDFGVELTDDEILDKTNSNGFDSPIFMFSANAGQPLRELSKIISGGELSRFMLAVKSAFADLDGINCMIFDEIDTGISGHIAQVVAQKLYKISKEKQVLAITHLPQLASMADSHYLIDKYVEDNQTKTRLRKLDGDELVQELARLVGGSDDSMFALMHAKEMKDNATMLKKTL